MTSGNGGRATGVQILRNGWFLLLAYVVPRVFTVASVVVAARWLGTGDFGVYGTAAALAVLTSVAASLGMLPLLVREIARAPERAPGLLRSAHRVKAGAAVAMLALTAVASGFVFPDRPDARATALVLALGWVAHAFVENLAAYYQAVERMGRWTVASALFGVVSSVVGIALLVATGSIVAYSAGFVAGWLAAAIHLQRGLPAAVRAPGPVVAPAGRLLAGLAPFAASFVGLTVYSKVDVLLLERMAGADAVGLYTAAYKAVDVFQALVLVAAGAVYPHLSRAALTREGAGTDGRRSLEWLLLSAVPLAMALHLAAVPLVALLFGAAYVDAGPVLARLALVLPMLSLTLLGGYALGAGGRMGRVAVLYAAGVTVNVALNLALIPRLGAQGAAWARLGSEGALMAGFLWALHRAGAAPGTRALGAAALTGAGAVVATLAPDPSGGWLRAGALLLGSALLYQAAGLARWGDLARLGASLLQGPGRVVDETPRAEGGR